MKKLFIFLFLIVAGLGVGIYFYISDKPAGEEPPAEAPDSLYYVALGDSIADGTALDGYQGYTFVENSYTKRFLNAIDEKYEDVTISASTYAKAGDNTDDFMLLITENQEAISAIQKADVISICIGANDILGPGVDNAKNYISRVITTAQIENLLTSGLQKFKTNFPNILDRLSILNSKAKIIFNTVYNPYACLEVTGQLALIAGYAGLSVSNANNIGPLTEIYLDGGTNSQNQAITGLNEMLVSFIEAENNPNYYIADVKSVFDKHITDNGEEKYSDVVNVDLSMVTAANLTSFTSYADPHPTAEGHRLIAEELLKKYNENICKVTFKLNGAILNEKTEDIVLVNKGDSVMTRTYQRGGYAFNGWQTKDGEFWTGIITQDVTLYASWIKVEENTLGVEKS